MKTHRLFLAIVLAAAAITSRAEDALSASALAAKLSAQQRDGDAMVRLKMEVKPSAGRPEATLQLQIKSRATAAGADLLYQVQYPKEQKGRAVLLRQASGRFTSGATFVPPDAVRPIKAGQLSEPLFGSDLSLGDVIENFFAWNQQTLAGTEAVGRTNCQILESKPGKTSSSYGMVRTWVDVRRLVPMRVEKYSQSGKLVRRIDTTRVVTDDQDRHIAANLTITQAATGSVTQLIGSSIKHNVRFTDADFSQEGMQQMGATD